MSRTCRFLLQFVTVIFLSAAVSYSQDSQSLGDVARQVRQQKTQVNHASGKNVQARKVVTNDEIPEQAASTVDGSGADQRPELASHHRSSEPGKLSAERWKALIQAQKNVVSSLQKQIDKNARRPNWKNKKNAWRTCRNLPASKAMVARFTIRSPRRGFDPSIKHRIMRN